MQDDQHSMCKVKLVRGHPGLIPALLLSCMILDKPLAFTSLVSCLYNRNGQSTDFIDSLLELKDPTRVKHSAQP